MALVRGEIRYSTHSTDRPLQSTPQPTFSGLLLSSVQRHPDFGSECGRILVHVQLEAFQRTPGNRIAKYLAK